MEIKPNNIYLGDCYELIKFVPDKSIDLIYTDIPYLYSQGGGGKSELGKNAAKKRLELMGINSEEINNLVENEDTRSQALSLGKKANNINDMENGIDFAILDEFVRIQPYIYIYIWCSRLQILPLMKYFVEEKGCLFDILTWHKTNPAPTHNCRYLSDTEYCLVFREKGTYFGGTTHTLKKYFISPLNKEDKDKYLHPCTKPTEFIKNHLINSTKPNDIVFDPFAGSCSTLAVAKQLGRRYLGFEIDKKWYQVGVDRLNGIDQNGQMDLLTTSCEQLDLFGGDYEKHI